MNQAKLARVDKGLRTGVLRAVQAARDYMLQIQNVDGHWCGELEGDTILESEYVLTMHFTGRLHEERCRKAANYIRQKMLPEGGWAIYEGGTGSQRIGESLLCAEDDRGCARRSAHEESSRGDLRSRGA